MSYSATVLATTGLTNYWRLGEPSGATTADAFGGATLTWNGTPTQGVAGLLANDTDTAVSLPGSVYADVASGSFPNTAPFAMEAWVQPSNLTGNHRWVSTGPSGGWAMGCSASGLFFTTFGVLDYFSVGSYLSLGVTHHVVGVFQTSFAIDFYVDGVFKETVTGSSDPTAASAGVAVGARRTNDEWFVGLLDEVALYNVALSSATILDHYTVGITPAPDAVYARDFTQHTLGPF